MILQEIQGFKKGLKSCRENQRERIKEIRQIEELVSRLTKGRETTEDQENRNAPLVSVALEGALKNAMGKVVSLVRDDLHSQEEFESDLLEKMRATIGRLLDNLEDQIPRMSPSEQISFAGVLHKMNHEDATWLLKSAKSMYRNRKGELPFQHLFGKSSGESKANTVPNTFASKIFG